MAISTRAFERTVLVRQQIQLREPPQHLHSNFLTEIPEQREQEDAWLTKATFPLLALETWDTLTTEQRDERVAAILGWKTRDRYGYLPGFSTEYGRIRHLVAWARRAEQFHYVAFRDRIFKEVLGRHHRTPSVGVATDADLFLDATPAEVCYALYATYGPLEGRLPRGGCWYVTPRAGRKAGRP